MRRVAPYSPDLLEALSCSQQCSVRIQNPVYPGTVARLHNQYQTYPAAPMAAPMEQLQAVVPPIERAPNALTCPVHISRLKQTVSLLLSPAERPSNAWRSDVVRSLREYMDADRALLLVWHRSEPCYYSDGLPGKVIAEYLADFAPLDHGMARRDALGLTLWSRARLWDREDLVRSAYYQDFAVRHDIMDSIGVSLDIEGNGAHVRAAMLYAGTPLSPCRVDTMLLRLDLLLPVLRTGLHMHLRYEPWIGALLPMLDRIGERLMLFSFGGRELHRNLSMQRTLEHDPDRERILAAAQSVARTVIAQVQAAGRETARRLGGDGYTHQEIAITVGRYRLHGCVVGPDAPDGGTAGVLVSVDLLAPEQQEAAALRERFKLTVREVQVATLLAQRMTNEEIADALGISTHTARHHTESVLLKTGVNSRRALHNILQSPVTG
jgi:DNA-binding CsgD family transcriptional regulator